MFVVVVSVLRIFVFLFKQNTVYERRISDWSSDVCSSELIVTGMSRKDELGDFHIGTTVERLARRAGLPLLIVEGRAEQAYQQLMAATDLSECSRTALTTAVNLFPELGRASGRERGGTYVLN